MNDRPTATLLLGPGDSPQWIVRTLRDKGKRVPRYVWQAGETQPPIGSIEVTWTVSEKHRRQMHVARLFGTGLAKDPLPLLRDVHIVQLQGGDLTLAGFELVEDREYAQTWFCRIARVGWVARGKPDDPTGDSAD